VESSSREEVIEKLKAQWKALWRERIDDKVRAEGIANVDYSMLFVEKGTVIFATRAFKPLNFRKILQQHELVDVDRVLPPSPHVGGWGKFIRTEIASQKRHKRSRRPRPTPSFEKKRQQLKKGGYGWLHFKCDLIRPRSR
jgi:hypothetical protein